MAVGVPGLPIGLSRAGNYQYEANQLHFPVPRPATVDFRVYENGGVYTTNISQVVTPPLTEGEAGVTTYYVDLAAGNDTTGNGTAGNPYKTVNKAFAELNAFQNTKSRGIIKAKGGRYARGQGWFQSVMYQDVLQVVSWDGLPVYLTVDYPSLSWSLESGTTYQATSDSSNPARSAFWDKKTLTVDGDYQRLALAASLAACRATPGSYFVSGTTMYVTLSDGRAPDADLVCMDNNVGNGIFNRPNGVLYAENVRFEGGAFSFQCNMSSSQTAPITFKFKDCWFKYGASSAIARDSTFSFQGNCTVVLWNSVISWAIQDGCGYNAFTSSAPCYAIEVGCVSRWNGYNTTGANQGSTMHVGGTVIRVNSVYHNNQDCQTQDVTGSKSWNIGSTMRDTQTADAAAGIGFALAGDSGTEGWFDGCTTSGCPADLLCGSGVRLNYARHTPATPTTTGAGTFSVYVPTKG